MGAYWACILALVLTVFMIEGGPGQRIVGAAKVALSGMEAGGKAIADIAVLLASAQIVVSMLGLTGLAVKFSDLLRLAAAAIRREAHSERLNERSVAVSEPPEGSMRVITHSFAARLAEYPLESLPGSAVQRQYTTERVTAPEVVALRGKVTAITSEDMPIDQAVLEARLIGGKIVRITVDKVIGSLENPLGERRLEEKFRDMTAPYLSPARQSQVVDMVWQLEQQPSVEELIKLCEADREP
jgi:hypothetical protein